MAVASCSLMRTKQQVPYVLARGQDAQVPQVLMTKQNRHAYRTATRVVLSSVGGGAFAVAVRTASLTTPTLALDQRVVVTLLAGVIFIVVATALRRFGPTRTLGHLLVSRLQHTTENWEKQTFRSCVELGTWLSVCWSAYESTAGQQSRQHALLLALLYGTLASVVVIVCGECVMTTRGSMSTDRWPRTLMTGCGAHTKGNEAPALLLCIYSGHGLLRLIYDHVHDLLVAGMLAGIGGFALLTAGSLFAAWPPTRHAGHLLLSRVAPHQTVINWRKHPLRSAAELCNFLGVTLLAYSSSQTFVVAVEAGTVAGILSVFAGEVARLWCGNSAPEPTRAGGERRSWGRARSSRDDSSTTSFLHLPSDVLHLILEHCDADTLRGAKTVSRAWRWHCRLVLTAKLRQTAGKDWSIFIEVCRVEPAWVALGNEPFTLQSDSDMTQSVHAEADLALRLVEICREYPAAFIAALGTWDREAADRVLANRSISDALRMHERLSTVLAGFEKWHQMDAVAQALTRHFAVGDGAQIRRVDVFTAAIQWPCTEKAARLTHALYKSDSCFNHTLSGLNNRLLYEVRCGRLDSGQHINFAFHMGQCVGERGTWLGDLVAWMCLLLYCLGSAAACSLQQARAAVNFLRMRLRHS